MDTFPDFSAPTALYAGLDTFQGHSRDTALSGTSILSGSSSSNTVSICTDTESVSEALSVSGSVSGSWVDGSADDKASFTQSLNMTSTSVVVIVHTVVDRGQYQAEEYDLTETASNDLAGKGVAAFFKKYGDSFVDTIRTGAEYYAAFVYDSTTVDEQRQITNSLKASAGTLNATLSTTLSDAQSSTQVTLRISQKMTGAGDADLPSPDPTDIVDFALNFTNQTASTSPTVLSFTTQGYEHAGVTGFDAVVTNRDLLGDTTFIDAITTLTVLEPQVSLIRTMYGKYQYTADTEFNTRAAQVDTDYAALLALLTAIETDVTATYDPLSLPSLEYGTPVVSYDLKPAPATVQLFDLTTTQIANGVTPARVKVTSPGFVVTYSDGTVVDHGSSANSVVGTVTVADGDYISLVAFPKGATSYMINQIQTHSGQSVGNGGTNEFVVQNPPQIIGFAADTFPVAPGTNEGGVIVGAITITLSPAVWTQPITSA